MRTSTPLARLPAMAPPDPARPRPPYRFIGTLALLGAALLTGGTVLHPAHADPGSPTAAFAEYAHAGRGTWVAAHLLQLGGAAGLVLVVVLLARAVDRTGGSGWARVTAIFGTAGLAVAAVLQAVDGVALKAMVDLWTGADEDRSSLFAGALAVRQIEIGLEALFALLLALAFLAFGIGLLIAPSGSRPLGALAAATAGAVAYNGVALALRATGVLGELLEVAPAVRALREDLRACAVRGRSTTAVLLRTRAVTGACPQSVRKKSARHSVLIQRCRLQPTI